MRGDEPVELVEVDLLAADQRNISVGGPGCRKRGLISVYDRKRQNETSRQLMSVQEMDITAIFLI